MILEEVLQWDALEDAFYILLEACGILQKKNVFLEGN
jgi:hypothetical protein